MSTLSESLTCDDIATHRARQKHYDTPIDIFRHPCYLVAEGIVRCKLLARNFCRLGPGLQLGDCYRANAPFILATFIILHRTGNPALHGTESRH